MRLKPASAWTGSRRTAPPDISANARTFLHPPRTSACLVWFGRGRLDERAFIVQYLVGPCGSFVLAGRAAKSDGAERLVGDFQMNITGMLSC